MPEATQHSFVAIAFSENFPLKELSAAYPEARRSVRELRYSTEGGGDVFLFPFGAVVFRDVPPGVREEELSRLRRAQPALTEQKISREEFGVRVVPGETPRVREGVCTVDELTPERAGIVALTVAQSAAMEYYERIVQQMFGRTGLLIDRLERDGTVAIRTRPLHRFIGEALATRSDVVSVLFLLDKPDETWDDPAMDRIYADLRSEFDLVDRYAALEMKLGGVQQSLELILGVVRERRLVLLEIAVILLIALELVVPLFR